MSFFGRIGKVEKFRPGSPGASPRELFFLPDSTYISRIDGENSRLPSKRMVFQFSRSILESTCAKVCKVGGQSIAAGTHMSAPRVLTR